LSRPFFGFFLLELSSFLSSFGALTFFFLPLAVGRIGCGRVGGVALGLVHLVGSLCRLLDCGKAVFAGLGMGRP
jgi:hypothetical protein